MSTSRSASRAALRLLHSSSASAPHASSSVLAVRSASASTSSVSSPRVSSPRAFGTAAPLRSAWPAGAQPEDADANRRAAPRPPRESGAQPKRFRTKGVRELRELKKEGTPITVMTAFDYPTALSLRAADVDICLVGDSLANVALGHASTQQLPLSAMVHHVQAVMRGISSPLLTGPSIAPPPLVIADLPFGSFYASLEAGVRAATALVQEGGAHGVKIEGGSEIVELVERLSSFGIPVIAHIGLQPQRVASSSGYRLQGRTADEASAILAQALELEAAGATAILIECVPNRVGAEISKCLQIPTIGIGAGPGTDGQVLVISDILGDLTSPAHVLADVAAADASTSAQLPLPGASTPQPPKFVRAFAAPVAGGVTVGSLRIAAVRAYVDAVRARTFPDAQAEGYKMKKEEFEEFKRRLGGDERRQQVFEQFMREHEED